MAARSSCRHWLSSNSSTRRSSATASRFSSTRAESDRPTLHIRRMQMTNQLSAARRFMAGHARLLDRRRFELLFAGADPEPVLAALRAYRNPDGGYGHGLEPDLRARESQPAPALHAFEVFAEAAPVTAPDAVELCDWLDSIALPDGGLPFALSMEDASGCAP